MVKKQLLLELNPTQTEKVSYVQKDFDLLTKFADYLIKLYVNLIQIQLKIISIIFKVY